MDEIWKDIDGYEGFYQVSNSGNVRSVDRTVLWNEVREMRLKGGQLVKTAIKNKRRKQVYEQVGLHKNGVHKQVYVHRLVAAAFIPRETGKNQINHKDSNGLNNHISNLEWCTNSENNLHKFVVPGEGSVHVDRTGEKSPKRIKQLSPDGTIVKIWESTQEAKRACGFRDRSIYRVLRGERHHYKGFRWEYL